MAAPTTTLTHRLFVVSLLTLLVLTGCQAARLNPPQDREILADSGDVVDDTELVVVTPSSAEARSLMQRASPLGYTLLARDTMGELGLTMLTVRIPEGQDGASAIRELEGLEPGITAGVNHAYRPQRQTSRTRPRKAREYAPRLLRWPEVGCRAQVAIGVLDSKLVGPALMEVTSADFSRDNRSENALHGTQVVSLLHSSGMLRSPRIFHADVVSPSERGGDAASVDSLVRGLNWVIGKGVRVVNVSLAGPYNKILDRAFASAERKGIIIVAPVGNAGPAERVRYPAAFRSTISVTAVDAETRIFRKAVRGRTIDFSAPGVDVAIRMPSREVYVSGTSFAAPFVTAAIAADPSMMSARDASSVRASLSRSARDLGIAGHDPVFGNGLVQAPSNCV
ncbi:MAG: S8 family serine peptidase [Pseudomonadota bacterium]